MAKTPHFLSAYLPMHFEAYDEKYFCSVHNLPDNQRLSGRKSIEALRIFSIERMKNGTKKYKPLIKTAKPFPTDIPTKYNNIKKAVPIKRTTPAVYISKRPAAYQIKHNNAASHTYPARIISGPAKSTLMIQFFNVK